MITGEETPDAGEFKVGETVKVSADHPLFYRLQIAQS